MAIYTKSNETSHVALTWGIFEGLVVIFSRNSVFFWGGGVVGGGGGGEF